MGYLIRLSSSWLLLSILVLSSISISSVVNGFIMTTSSSAVVVSRQGATKHLFMADVMKQQPSSSSSSSSSSSGDESSKKDQSNNNNNNMAKYLVDLNDSKETFDFCGGMMFQLVLTDSLRDHLMKLSSEDDEGGKDDDDDDVTVYKNTPRMYNIPNYDQSSNVDNLTIFHGREIRNVKNAAGGMGMVLQLSLADNGNDPEGWTEDEIQRYDGWGHDSGREWRKGSQLVEEGYTSFPNQFGSEAFSLHHRFYLHRDFLDNLWLAAEDGCQGTPKKATTKKNISNLFGLLS